MRQTDRCHGKRMQLTGRERAVARRIVAGQTSNQIGHALGISPRTVESHRIKLNLKLRATTMAGLIVALLRERIVKVKGVNG